jgi:hypothetical protein
MFICFVLHFCIFTLIRTLSTRGRRGELNEKFRKLHLKFGSLLHMFRGSLHLCRGTLVSLLCLPELCFGGCFLLYHVCLGWACELGVLFSLSHEFRVSFVCSLVLVHVFRGSLWFLCSCAGGVEPLCLFLRSRVLWEEFLPTPIHSPPL